MATSFGRSYAFIGIIVYKKKTNGKILCVFVCDCAAICFIHDTVSIRKSILTNSLLTN